MLLAALVAASVNCAPVPAVIGKGMPPAFSEKLVERTSKSFGVAYSKACAGHYLKTPLINSGTKDKRLFLHNAPSASVASIYVTSGRTVLEYPFVSENGKTKVPSMNQLLEAIYCAAHGATAKEQEESGRCLPD